MPKLSEKAVDRKKGRIEYAAKQLFIKQGFHATSMRNIAARAGTSLGNLYNYYPTKEAILGSIISKYQRVIDDRLRSMFDELRRSGTLHEGVDPAIGFTAAYMQFFNYFIVEKLFGGNRHLGISDEQAISSLTDIYSRGLLRSTNHRGSGQTKQKTGLSLRGHKRTSR